MPENVVDRSASLLAAMRARALEHGGPQSWAMQVLDSSLDANTDTGPVACAGNQHTCQPRLLIPSLGQRFDMVLKGTGDSVIVGPHDGPRALVWQDTQLEGTHPFLGKVTVRLEPAAVHAGTLLPLAAGAPFPALNRNTYFFVFNVALFGDLISERPAVVEALIDEVPPTASYVFRNGPLNLYKRGDPTRTTIAVLEGLSQT